MPLLALTISVTFCAAPPTGVELRGSGAAMRLELDSSGTTWIGVDGLVASSPNRRLPISAPKTRLVFGDSLDLARALPDEGQEPAWTRAAPPCSLVESSREKSPGSLYDFMLFGDAALQPWVRLQCDDSSGWARLPALPLRLADSGKRISFPTPAILRAPFLQTFVRTPLASESAQASDRLRFADGSLETRAIRTDSVSFANWNWSVVHDPHPGNRNRIDARSATDGKHIWILAWNESHRSVTFDDAYRREPRRVTAFRSPRSRKPYLALEVSTLFGDGIWTDLWVAGPDTIWSLRIGERNGESGADQAEHWKVSPRTGTVSVTESGRFQTRFRAP